MNEWEDSSEIQEKFDKVYLEYRPILLQYIMAIVQNVDIAEDILQETFYVAIRRKEIFNQHSCKIGWLYRTAAFKIKEYYRKWGMSDEIVIEPEQVEPCDVEEGYSKTEMDMVLYERLTEEEILRFRRYFIWGETIAEIAKKECITENNMRVRISRLKLKIETILQQE